MIAAEHAGRQVPQHFAPAVQHRDFYVGRLVHGEADFHVVPLAPGDRLRRKARGIRGGGEGGHEQERCAYDSGSESHGRAPKFVVQASRLPGENAGETPAPQGLFLSGF